MVDKVYENKLRRKADRLGLMLQKSRAKEWHLDNQQGYRIIEKRRDLVLAGEKYNLQIEDVEQFLERYEQELRKAAQA